jgi:hypothetical protein
MVCRGFVGMREVQSGLALRRRVLVVMDLAGAPIASR